MLTTSIYFSRSRRLSKLAAMDKYVRFKTEQTRRKQKVVVLMELHRAIIHRTEMSKQVTKSDVRDA
jgi:hypothetical protein